MRSSGIASLLGITFEGERMTLVLLRRSGARFQVRQLHQTPLSLDPFSGDPELVGREIRNRLSEAGVTERRCVICVPLRWALTMRCALPELPEEEVDSYLTLQAERGFPFAPDDLSRAVSRFRTPQGVQEALLAAIPVNHLIGLQKALAVARLRPVGITVGVSTLINRLQTTDGNGALALLVSEQSIELAIASGGGMVALRSLSGGGETDEESKNFSLETVGRQLRITLGQLTPEMRKTIKTARIYGPDRLVEPLLEELRETTQHMDLSVEIMRGDSKTDLALQAASGVDENKLHRLPGAIDIAAARYLQQQRFDFNFLLIRPSRLQQIGGRIASRRTAWLGGVAAAFIIIVSGLFGWKFYQISRLKARWQKISQGVEQLQAVQDKIRKTHNWFDESPQYLLITQKLAEAFPRYGTVVATSLTIREKRKITCSGKAETRGQLLELLDNLGNIPEFVNLHYEEQTSSSGSGSAVQFTLIFEWNGGRVNGL